MNRREFLTAAKTKNDTPRFAARSLSTGMAEYSGPWTQKEARHLLKRTMFGARTQDVDYLAGLTVSQAVDELLSASRTVSPPLRDYGLIDDNNVMADDPTIQLGQTWVNDLNSVAATPTLRASINRLRIESLRKWWAGTIITQQRSIEEKMVLFWHHHYSVQKEEVDDAGYLYRHHDLLRKNYLGNVRELTKLVTVDAAMLKHLNGYLNSKKAPDENYARELQELFTVGKGPDSLYTESDVREAARVLTGWRINHQTSMPMLDVKNHDTGNKTFSSFYNNTTIAGNSDGLAEIDQLINMIFATSECPKFICRKLYKWFIYYNIDEQTEASVITPMAEMLKNNNFEIRPVLSALLKSEHFFDAASRACYIKSPYDFIAGTLRELNVVFPDYTDYVTGYPLFDSLYKKAAEMQQDLFQPPDVSGWPAYHQEPMHYELWVNSNTLPKRSKFTDDLVDNNLVDMQALTDMLGYPSNADDLVGAMTEYLLCYPLSPSSKTYIVNNILAGQNDTQKLLKFILNLPEYHLC